MGQGSELRANVEGKLRVYVFAKVKKLNLLGAQVVLQRCKKRDVIAQQDYLSCVGEREQKVVDNLLHCFDFGLASEVIQVPEYLLKCLLEARSRLIYRFGQKLGHARVL